MASTEHVKRVWTIGSYPDIGETFLSMAAHLVDSATVDADDHVLDVACGTGNIAITAARRGAAVTGLDITPNMLEDARENASLAGVEDTIDWEEGDAANMPFEDDTFDVTFSCVGHMFANPPEAAATELLRVTRPGGRIAFTSWTPRSVVPAMAKVLQEYLPPDPDAPAPPFLWGDSEVVQERLGEGVTDLTFETGVVEQFSLSPAHVWERVRTQSGMFIVALENVDEDDYPALRADMIGAIDEYFDESKNAMSMEYRLTEGIVE